MEKHATWFGVLAGVLVLFGLAGCSPPGGQTESGSLLEARKGFHTKLTQPDATREPVPTPPASAFRLVRYDAPSGQLAAYLTPPPRDARPHPAIIWITGGDCNSIGDVWSPAPPDNDQTAAAYRAAGIVMMFPSLRGGNDNPGQKEGFLGEVDDVLAAADFLAGQSYVDANRIYLGGHSTGGTLVLLVAECSARFRAVFSFGPVDNVRGYPKEFLPFSNGNPQEFELRSPGRWLASIQTPTFVFEGTGQGNLASLRKMEASCRNPSVHFIVVDGASHFSVLAPTNRRLAAKILADAGPAGAITVTADDLHGPEPALPQPAGPQQRVQQLRAEQQERMQQMRQKDRGRQGP